jgi:hypothetical protein
VGRVVSGLLASFDGEIAVGLGPEMKMEGGADSKTVGHESNDRLSSIEILSKCCHFHLAFLEGWCG